MKQSKTKRQSRSTSTRPAERINPIQEFNNGQQRLAGAALRAGQKARTESLRDWSDLLGQAASGSNWQRGMNRFTQLAATVLPQAQQRLADVMELAQHNGRAGVQLARQALDAAQSPTLLGSQAKWLEFWAASMKAFETSTQSATRLSTRAIDGWIELLKRSVQTS